MTKQLINMVNQTFSIERKNIYYIPIGDVGSGAQLVARHLRAGNDVPQKNVVDLLTLTRIHHARTVELIVFIEDFSGTGQTIEDWWRINEPIILPIGAKIVMGVLVLNIKAQKRLEKEHTTISVKHLTEVDNVFSDYCSLFTSEEKQNILEFCEQTGCSSEFLRGYGECGLLLASPQIQTFCDQRMSKWRVHYSK